MAGSSEVYDRVVKRRMSTNKVLISLVVCFAMVAGAFVMAANSQAGSPTVQVLGWNLKPEAHEGWTSGNVKGYCEGDAVPIHINIDPDGEETISLTIGFEWGYGAISDPDRRGFKEVVEYSWVGEPYAPFNDPVFSPEPFSVGLGATIDDQTHLGPMYEEGSLQIWDEWLIELTIVDDSEDIYLRAGGLLFLTEEGMPGAAYYPGASLHVRVIYINEKKCSVDVPFMVDLPEVLTPPNVILEKFCSPYWVAEDDKITFKLRWENTGQANATIISLEDWIPEDIEGNPLLQFVSGSAHMWNSSDATKVPVPDPLLVDGVNWCWLWLDTGWTAEGTGLYDINPVMVYYLEFEALVIGWKLGVQENFARLIYTDDHNVDPYLFAEDSCWFDIILPGIIIDKWEVDRLTCAAGEYVYESGMQGEPTIYPGDVITYVIRVTNPSPDVAMKYAVYDPVIAVENGWLPTLPIHTGTLGPGDYWEQSYPYLVKGTEPEPESTDYMFRNTASVIAYDVVCLPLGHKVVDSAYWDIDILHPDLSITKTSECEVVFKVGEVVHYTITVENTGDATLPAFEVWDLMIDPVDPLYEAVEGDPGDDLSPGEILTLTRTHAIQEADIDSFFDVVWMYYVENTVWIEAYDTQDHYLYRAATLQIPYLEGAIEITKTAVDGDGNPMTYVGSSQQVRYEIEVDNVGEVGLWWFYWDDFDDLTDPTDEQLVPEDSTTPPEIPFDDPVPVSLEDLYDARLWAGYLEPGDAPDVRYYTYDVQDEDPDPLVNIVYVYGWHTKDGTVDTDVCCPDAYITDDDGESVDRYGWIQGWVYYDTNLDAVKQGTESGLASWVVDLYDDTWTYIDTYVTATGEYIFDNLPTGSYYVRETLISSDWFPTNPEGTDSPSLSVLAGSSTEWDFGNAMYSYIWGYKWLDWDMDGEREAPYGDMEPYLDGWVIHCVGWEYDDDMSLPPTVHLINVTGDGDWPDGYYEFKIKAGTYCITEEIPADDPLTVDVDESAWYRTFPENPQQHFDVDVPEGEEIPYKNFGNVPLTKIWGHKYYDKNMDGVFDEGDIGLNDWTMTLDDGDPATAPLTAISGERAIDVMFAIDLSGSMPIWSATIESTIASIMTSLASAGVDARFGVITFVDYVGFFTTNSGDSFPATYATTYGTATTGDYPYQLDQPLTTDTTAVQTLVDNLVYRYGGDAPQNYARIIHESWNDPAITWRYCTERVLVMFGDAPTHDSNFDYNDDGINDNTGGDPGRDGILGTIDDLDFEAEVAAAAAHEVHIMSVMTPQYLDASYEWQYMASETGGGFFGFSQVADLPDAIMDIVPDGYFVFKNLKPGHYVLGEEFPAGQEGDWYITTDPDDLEFDFPTPEVPGNMHRDVGNMRWAKIVGYKFVDTYEGLSWPNGVMDPDEYGYAGWKISIDPYVEDPCTYTSDEPLGYYEFTHLTPGNYVVWEEVLEGWVATTPWLVFITIPAHPWGDPVVIRLDFGNIVPELDPRVPFVLEEGWNLWSSPVDVTGLTAKGLLEAIGPSGLLVTRVDDGTGLLKSYMAGWDLEFDFPIEQGDGYYVYVTERTHFTLMGDQIGPSEVALVSGWNLVGYNLLTPLMASELLSMVSGCDALLVTYLDAGTGLYHSYMTGWDSEYDFQLLPGRAYFIWVDGPGALVFG